MYGLGILRKALQRHMISPASASIHALEPRQLLSANILVNGNFSRGAVGFTTGYVKGGSSLLPAATYAVGFNPQLFHFGGANFGDHTTGTGKMLLVNGSPVAGAAIWKQSVKVTPGVDYNFQGWAASWATNGPSNGDIAPAQPQITIDGKVILATTLPAQPGDWISLSGTWLATASKATITITDLNVSTSGNDSAYDDLSFTALASIHGKVIAATVNSRGTVSKRLTPLNGVKLFLDNNGNGTLDADESVAITNKAGAYVFTGLFAGTYQVRQINPPAYNLPPGHLTITVGSGKQLGHENLLDLYTAVLPHPGTFL